MTWEVALADLNGDGVADGIFRLRGSKGGNLLEALYVESPAKKDVLEGATLSRRRALEIMKPKKEAPPLDISVKSPWTFPNDRKLKDTSSGEFFEIVRIHGKHYILASDAFFWFPPTRYLKVTLLEYRNAKDLVIRYQFLARRTVFLR